MEKVLSGKQVAHHIFGKIKAELETCKVIPKMLIIRVGNDPASEFYVLNIIKQGSKLGLDIHLFDLDEYTATVDLINIIRQSNNDPNIHGIMVQKPLPKHIDDDLVNNTIAISKDVDGINPLNLGKLFLGQTAFVPCTAAAVIELVKFYNIETCGKNMVILGRSSVVGMPLIGLLLQKNRFGDATVTVCHSKTKDIKSITNSAEIIISAIGRPKFVTADMIKNDAICIDVGINLIKDDNNREVFVGDFDYNSCFEKALAITPVPGGIGTITTAILLNNLVKASI